MNNFQRVFCCALSLMYVALPSVAVAQSGHSAVPSRIVSAADNSRVVQLPGNTHPLVQARFDRGAVPAQMPMEHMLLLLQRSAEQQAALDTLVAQQSDRSSANYHRWLSPTEFGQQFGPSDADIAQVTSWLRAEGLTVDKVSNGRVTIEFSGAAAQVQAAFHTEIHNYMVNGEMHVANNSDPSIPEALTPVVAGVSSLNNFFAKPQSVEGRRVRRDSRTGAITPADGNGNQPSAEFTRVNSSGATIEDVTPYDFATIYNLLPLWNSNINGAGQTIAIAGESDINKADVATFQSTFGLPSNPPTIVYPNGNPGINTNAEEQELDVEWAGATAPGAKILLVVIPSTNSTGGFQLSSQYVIDNRSATILSESYGQCEQSLGTTANATLNALWQQGSAEGISIFGAAGDQGAAGCENSDLYQYNPATTGVNVNGIASSPYITAVGGTDLNWQTSATSTYWNSTNSANDSTALGYIPEIAWNATCTSPYLVSYLGAASAEANCNTLAASTTMSNLVYITGGSGGVSACTTVSRTGACSGGWPKPSWQAGTGVPADGKRDLPDMALFAGSGIPDGISGSSYLICYSGSVPCSYGVAGDVVYQEIGGTSVSAPAMAGIMALVQQKLGAPQGLANPILYQLAAAETLSACNSNTVASGNSCVFYDTTSGTNAMACASGSTNCVVATKGDKVGLLSGYSTTTGYDQATGLGSVNATNLVNAWAALPSPTMTFSIPNQTYSTSPLAVSASSNSSGAITYSIVSGPATISGSTVTLTGMGTVTVQAFQAPAGGYTAGSITASFTVTPAPSSVSWTPSATTLFGGSALGTGILDATGSVAGTITYTAALGSATATTVTSTSTLANVGVYTLTATLTPTNNGYNPSTATINLTVTSAYVWAINPSGSISEFYGNTPVTSSAVNGGGIGAAVDNGGNLWTLNAGGNSLAEFNSSGTLTQGGLTGGGISAATGLAIDGNGAIWVVNGNSSVSVFSNGAASTPGTGYTGGNLSQPSGVAIDTSGNVWISNAANNSVTEILGAAAPVSPTATALKNGTLGARP